MLSSSLKKPTITFILKNVESLPQIFPHTYIPFPENAVDFKTLYSVMMLFTLS